MVGADAAGTADVTDVRDATGAGGCAGTGADVDGLAIGAPRVGLFVTCLVDLFRPTIGLAAVALLEAAGCRVEVPTEQTCCGQPAYNSGDRVDAEALAREVIAAFAGCDYVVAPSGSCAGMIREHYPRLLADDATWAPRARALAERTYELLSFLVDVRGMTAVDAACPCTATYHDSCSGRRELGVVEQPRRLLASVEGLTLTELPAAEREGCCGFGGTFCVKYPEISTKMADAKCRAVMATGADTLLGGDLGCLLNLSGRLTRIGATIAVRHVVEVLAGVTGDVPPIGDPRG